jgi:NADH:ubiquinone oxidoreductase subunit 3 (subunit A)
MNPFLAPLFTFFLMLFLAYLIYVFGGKLAPKTQKSDAKLSQYACGEDIPGGKVTPTFAFFQVAFIFTVFHVSVLLLITVPSSTDALYGLLFLVGLLASAAVMLKSGVRK